MEEWKKIPGYSWYEISTEGRIRNINTNKILSPYIKNTNTGTQVIAISITGDDGKRRFFSYSRLLYTALVGPIPDKMDIDHKDRNPLNNSLDNLRLATRSQNVVNQKRRKGRTSMKGTRLLKDGKWESRTTVNNKLIYLGRYNTELEAHEKYLEFINEKYGEFVPEGIN